MVRWWAVESVGYLILYVRDVDVSAAFYRDVVGLPFKLRDAGYVEFVTGGTRFGLLERTRASDLIRREPTEGGPAGEVLFIVDDVDAEAERLRGLGVECRSGPVDRPWGTGPSTSSIQTLGSGARKGVGVRLSPLAPAEVRAGLRL